MSRGDTLTDQLSEVAEEIVGHDLGCGTCVLDRSVVMVACPERRALIARERELYDALMAARALGEWAIRYAGTRLP